MMRLAPAVLAALVLLVPAAALGAKPHVSAVINTEASNGYRLSLKTSRHSATLDLSRGHASATYEPRGKVRATARRVRFGLGPLGRVDLRFHESGRSDSSGGHCEPAFSERVGEFRGLLRFRGEGGYSQVDTDRVNGRVFKFGHLGCHGQPLSRYRESDRRERPFLIACGPADGGLLLAQRVTADLSLFAAFTSERTRYAWIDRSAVAIGKAGTFQTSGHLAAAELDPPGPLFKGTASYASGATSGDLTALLPGLGDEPMVPGDALLSKDYRDHPPRCMTGNRSAVIQVLGRSPARISK